MDNPPPPPTPLFRGDAQTAKKVIFVKGKKEFHSIYCWPTSVIALHQFTQNHGGSYLNLSKEQLGSMVQVPGLKL